MAERGRKKLTAGEALEVIFAGEDSNNETFDCGSDAKVPPDTEDELITDDSDLDASISMPQGEISKEITTNIQSLEIHQVSIYDE